MMLEKVKRSKVNYYEQIKDCFVKVGLSSFYYGAEGA